MAESYKFEDCAFRTITKETYDQYIQSGMSHHSVVDLDRQVDEKDKQELQCLQEKGLEYISADELDNLIREGSKAADIRELNKCRETRREEILERYTLRDNVKNKDKLYKSMGELFFYVIGLKKEGKSATIQTFFGQDDSCRKKQETPYPVYEGLVGGKNATATEVCLDVNQLEDVFSDFTDEDAIHAVIYVVNISNHQDLPTQALAWKKTKKVLGDNWSGFVAHSFLVLTHADVAFKDISSVRDLYNGYVHDKEPLSSIMLDLYPRIVAINNSANEFEKKVYQEILISEVTETVERTRLPMHMSELIPRVQESTPNYNCIDKPDCIDKAVQNSTKCYQITCDII